MTTSDEQARAATHEDAGGGTRPTPATATCSTCRRPTAAATRKPPTWPATRSACSPGPPATSCSRTSTPGRGSGVEGHLEAERPWLPYHELLTEPAARLVGALPARDRGDELADGQPAPADGLVLPADAGARTAIVDRGRGVPVRQLRGAQPGRASTASTPTTRRPPAPARRRGHAAHRGRRRRSCARGRPVALVLLGGVNYLTGELMDIPAITAAGQARGRGRRLGPGARGRQRAAARCTTGTSTSPPGARTST